MNEMSDTFREAASDYAFLLDRSYPGNTILELVGTRYGLSRKERNILYRGVFVKAESKKRNARLIKDPHKINLPVYIDGNNQLYTLAAYLNGDPVFKSTDGFVRDAASDHGSGKLQKFLERAVELLSEWIRRNALIEVYLYLDKHLAPKDHAKLFGSQTGFKVMISNKVDQSLRAVETGTIATSDSQIIDKAKVPVFDLSAQILRDVFSANFLSLKFLNVK